MLTLLQQQAHLQQVSRTFALTIPVLPAALADWVGNAYLLCRIVDTIEDDPSLLAATKQQHIQSYLAVLSDPEASIAWAQTLSQTLAPETPVGEQDLIADIPAVLRRLNHYPSDVQAILRRGVEIMSRGMALQQSITRIQGREELDRYCYYVAGVVGELLVELFAVHSRAIQVQRQNLLPLAVSFGEGLQLTNILKDIWADAARGVCWLPVDPALSGLADCTDSQRIALVREYLALAHGHLQDALDFTLKLPRREYGIRQFCLWALGMALLTLQRIQANPLFAQACEVKISRQQVKRLVLMCRLLGLSNHMVRQHLKRLATGLPVQVRSAVVLYKQVSVWYPPRGEHG